MTIYLIITILIIVFFIYVLTHTYRRPFYDVEDTDKTIYETDWDTICQEENRKHYKMYVWLLTIIVSFIPILRWFYLVVFLCIEFGDCYVYEYGESEEYTIHCLKGIKCIKDFLDKEIF